MNTPQPATSRRTALGLGIAAITTGMSASAISAPNGDDHLIALCAEALRCEQRMTEIDTYGTTEEDCAATTDEWDRIFIKIARTPATTPAGMRAKAAVVSTAVCRESCDSDDDLTNPKRMDCGRLDGVLARSLCADILGGAA